VLGVAVRVVVPIFVAMDPVGALPLVFAWTGSLDNAERERQLRDALLTALALGLVFVLGGRWLLGILGAVPIGTPILAGPATLATLLVLVDDFGWLITGVAFLLNLLLAWRLFRRAGQLTRLFGRNGLRAASKVTSLILAAIAVRLIRDGILAVARPAS
jgi:multiple antibiotic resistance protein